MNKVIAYYNIKRFKVINLITFSIFLLFVGGLIISCKKDYQTLAIEFERNLPDTMEVLIEQINEIDHFVYYKNKSNTELLCYDLDKETIENIRPKISNTENVYGIYSGKGNISCLIRNGGLGSSLIVYNLKTMKFKDIESFWGRDNNDAIADEGAKTITGYASQTKYVYDFDGNKISEEEEYPANEVFNDEKPLQNWECRYCHQIIQSREDPNLQFSRCSVQNLMGDKRHGWVSLGRVY